MDHRDTLFWLRTVAYLTIAGIVVSLSLEQAAQLPWLLVGLAVFTAALPMWRWALGLVPAALFAVLCAQAVLVAAGQYVSGKPGTIMLLFFILIPLSARLPRRFSLLCYTLFPFLACLPYLIGSDPRSGWSVVAGIVPGFLSIIAFSEAFWALRTALEAKQKLLDELVEAQRRAAETSPALEGAASPEAEVLTRRDREVLSLVATGFSNKEIADKLFLAEGTVKNRVSQLLEKIGARDRTQAALRAREWGVL